MSTSGKIGAVILGAVIAIAILKFYSMSEEEREEFFAHLKRRANDLLDDAEGTVEKVKQHLAEIDEKAKDAWADKMLILRRMLDDLFGSEKRFLS